MSRNYAGMKPLRGLGDPIRTEAAAWREVIAWRDARRLQITEAEKAQAYAAIAASPEASIEMKASIAPR